MDLVVAYDPIARDAGSRGTRAWWVRTVRTLLLTAILVILLGNVVIYFASMSARRANPHDVAMPGIQNFRVVDERLWRGAAPTAEGYAALASNGVRTVVDLRAEGGHVPVPPGLDLVRIPIRDGQPPTAAQIEDFLKVLANADGPIYVHCGAGVGRTGSMVSAYLVQSGAATPSEARELALSVGPPSLEQIAFISQLDGERPSVVVKALSRFIDAPRRIWARISA